jgi:hypothetical protein
LLVTSFFANTIDVVMPLDAPALIFCDAAFVAHLQQVGATSETPIGVVPCADWTARLPHAERRSFGYSAIE